MPKDTPESANQRWVAYRPEIKVLDCTVRDGGLINEHQFDDAFVRRIYDTLVAAGVDYMEIGYKASKKIFSRKENGAWKFCDEEDIRRIVGDNPTSLKIAVMADADRTDYRTDILPKEKSVVDCVRVACYIHQVPLALDMVKDAHQKGYETMFQLMAVSTVNRPELTAALEQVARSEAAGCYVVDSFGSLYSEQIRDLVGLYTSILSPAGKDVGFHGHNNLQLGFANTIEALIAGANRLDATISGLGRGAGNCPLELLIGFLHNPKFHQRPVIQACEEVFVPLSKKMDWGYSIPYALTGQLNQHPRAAMEARASQSPDAYTAFYDSLVEEAS